MKARFNAFFMAWGMFLAIPCPVRKWDEGQRSRMLVCLPFIGVIVGGLWALIAWLTELLALPRAVAALLLAALPWLVTGFLHLDGYSDVCDAMLSHRDLQTRQKILKDPHCGAFGVICLMLLVLAQFCVFFSAEKAPQAACGSIMPCFSSGCAMRALESGGRSPIFGLIQDPRFAFLLSLGLIPVASRACAGLAVLSLRSMKTSQYAEMNGVNAADAGDSPNGAELKTEGVADLSVQAADSGAADTLPKEREKELASELALRKKQHARFRVVLAALLILAAAVPALLFGVFGLAPAAAALFYWIFALIAYKNLDGMNGDISGFALTLGELFGAAVLVFVQGGFAQRTVMIG